MSEERSYVHDGVGKPATVPSRSSRRPPTIRREASCANLLLRRERAREEAGGRVAHDRVVQAGKKRGTEPRSESLVVIGDGAVRSPKSARKRRPRCLKPNCVIRNETLFRVQLSAVLCHKSLEGVPGDHAVLDRRLHGEREVVSVRNKAILILL